MIKELSTNKLYIEYFSELKERIRNAQLRAARAVNSEAILLYWHIGHDVIEKQQQTKWGSGFITHLSQDLLKEFPGMSSFSVRNLRFMRQFAENYPDIEIVKQVASLLPWWHIILLLQKVKTRAERDWYMHQAIEAGWSRAVLWHNIDTKLYQRQVSTDKTTNFLRTLSSPQSEMAEEMLKNPYTIDFLNQTEIAHERVLQKELTQHLSKFLVELGVGFSFVGSQYPVTTGETDGFIDLLFYHLKLRCFVVVELKMIEFQPEHAGKMAFYLSAVDDHLRHPDDKPSIGIILCKAKDNIAVEYALRDSNKPIGVSTYQLLEALPKEIQTGLPTIEQLENEFSNDEKIVN
ncbi:MAG: PDDEXK nuclease domain-containing protein [Gammaproteobacteria bacterium]